MFPTPLSFALEAQYLLDPLLHFIMRKGLIPYLLLLAGAFFNLFSLHIVDAFGSLILLPRLGLPLFIAISIY